MSYSNRAAALLGGCPDPGGVLYPEAPVTTCPGGFPARRRRLDPKVTQLVLPASGVTVRQLAEQLGLPTFAVVREFIELGLFFPHGVQLDRAAVGQLCSRFGVSVTPAA